MNFTRRLNNMYINWSFTFCGRTWEIDCAARQINMKKGNKISVAFISTTLILENERNLTSCKNFSRKNLGHFKEMEMLQTRLQKLIKHQALFSNSPCVKNPFFLSSCCDGTLILHDIVRFFDWVIFCFADKQQEKEKLKNAINTLVKLVFIPRKTKWIPQIIHFDIKKEIDKIESFNLTLKRNFCHLLSKKYL
jgi:hypothetical protein